jgi:glycosyltransferase involved in cell wall biosynthesis
MRVATVICTYNRAESLRRALGTLACVERPAGVSWEVILVDNHSTDHTNEVCHAFEGRLPIRYCFEPKRGKSSALNSGIRSTTADLLLFTDDDVDVDPLWLRGFAEAAERMPGVPFFAGRILAQFDGTPPRWFEENARSILSGVAVHHDLGEHECPVATALGANMAIRAAAFSGGRSFRADLGPDGTDTVRSEESELFHSLHAASGHAGPAGMYIPRALVLHRTNASRASEAYVRRWYYGEGIARVRRNQIDPGKMLFGVPRYLWRKLVMSALKYAVLRPFAPSKSWLVQEIEMASTLGIIRELRRVNRMRDGG